MRLRTLIRNSKRLKITLTNKIKIIVLKWNTLENGFCAFLNF